MSLQFEFEFELELQVKFELAPSLVERVSREHVAKQSKRELQAKRPADCSSTSTR